MFKKPLAHQSNATPLRSSARRQLLASITAQYPLLVPSGDENEGQSGKEVGKLVLPEGVRTSTFETSAGVEGTFWLSPGGDPLWMSFGRNSKECIPTLYLLSLPLPTYPLPVIELHSPLPPPILTGAPLFIAAVKNLRKPWLLPDIPKDTIVAFTTAYGDEDGVRYVGVGRIMSEGGMRGAVERREQVLREGVDRDEGKFCDILCIIGDHLWESGSKVQLQSFQPPLPDNTLSPNPESDRSQAGPSRPRPSSPSRSDAQDTSEVNSKLEETSINTTPQVKSLSPSEISTLLSLALYQSLTDFPITSLPIPASLLYSAHVLPNRPAFIPQVQRDDVVIAKSEWKKLGKWMKEVGKEGLIKVKETKGEVIVTGIDPKHPSIQNHASHHTIAEEETKAAKKAAREAAQSEATSTSSGGVGGTGVVGYSKGKEKEIPIEELWKPSSNSIPFWEACGLDKTKLNPPSLLKSALDAYSTKHHLFDRAEPRYLLLDEELGRACGVKKPEKGQKMSREEIMKKLRAGVVWQVSVNGVIKKGTLQPITLSVKTRQGRKTITLITGLETFSIAPEEFAEDLKKLCAGSTTVSPLAGASPKLGLSEVMVQGSWVKVITDALVTRGVPKKWIKEGDKK